MRAESSEVGWHHPNEIRQRNAVLENGFQQIEQVGVLLEGEKPKGRGVSKT